MRPDPIPPARPRPRLWRIAGISLALVAAAPALAQKTASPWKIDLRYRFENVDDDGFARDADANTVRLRLGYLHTLAPGWTAFLEGERVEALNHRFNSTANGRTGFPVVADPQSTEINQVWAAYKAERIEGRIGRQRILIDNQRFLGNVGWRQNEQTFDALWLAATPLAGLRVQYGYIERVQRIFSDEARNPLLRERNHDSHFLDAAYAVRPGWSLAAYTFLLKDQDLAADSSATWGLRFTGKQALSPAATLDWRLEYAHQTDYRNQPLDFGLDYWRFEPGLSAFGVHALLGWEHLEGDGRKGFSTPLATLHAFNGWADRFLATPAAGIDDRFAGVDGSLGKAKWTVVWHDFDAERGDAGLGREWDVSLGYPLPAGVNALVKLADYRSDGFGADVRKVWFQLEWKYN